MIVPQSAFARVERYQQQRRALARERILEAALALAREDGWSNLTMRRIAERVQFTHPALYGYFSTKDALLTDLLRRGLQQLQADMDAAQASTDDPRAMLLALADAYWAFAWRQPELYQVMHGLGGVAFTTADLQAEERRIGAPVARAIILLFAQHGREPDDLEQKVLLLWSSLHGLVTLSMAGRFSRDEAAGFLPLLLRDSLVAWGIDPIRQSD